MNTNNSSDSLINQIYNIVVDVFKHWQLIILMTVLCAVLFDTYAILSYKPMYRCEATFSIKSTTSSSTDSNQNVGETFSYIFSSNIFKGKIEDALNKESLDGTYHASVLEGTNVLNVYAQSPSIKTSYDMMNALMDNYQDISYLVVGSTNIEVLKDITVPTNPYNQLNHNKNLILAGGLGFIFIVSILAFLSFIKETIKDKDDIERKLNLRLLGSLPKESKIISYKDLTKKKSILISQFSTSFAYIEAFKAIRTKIERYANKHNAKVLMVTSAVENEGKSSVAVNLALSLALNKHKVLLIDGDLKKPSLHLILDEHQKRKGIGEVLTESFRIDQAIIHLPQYSLDALFGYEYHADSSELVVSKRMNDILEYAKRNYDYVIIDSAPSRYLPDSRLLATIVDAIILVVRQNNATISNIIDAIEKLSLSKTPIIGCINNRSISLTLQSGKYYGYKYGSQYRYGTRRGKRHE